MAGAISMVLASTIANVAVPTVMGAFGVGQDQAQWLATGFVATMVASQLLSAWFARALGVRGAFVVVNIVFFTGTAVCFFSPNIEMLILGRVLQGFAAGVVQPMIMALIFGGSCGVTALVVFIEQRTEFHAQAMAATQTPANTTSIELLSRIGELLTEMGVSENVRGPGALHFLSEVIEAQAAARGFNDGFLMIAIVFILAAIPAWNIGKGRRPRR